MSDLWIFILLGLGSGAFIAGLGVSLVVSYRGSGTINLGAGATAMVSAYVYHDLRVGGSLVLPPIPFVPGRLSFGGPLSVPLALAIAIGSATLIGFLIDTLVTRRLQGAAPLSKLIASLGLLLLLQAWMLVRFGVDGLSASPVLAQGSITAFGIPVPTDRLLFAVIVIMIAIGLTVLYRRTRFGYATAAAAEDDGNAMRFGLSPKMLSLSNSLIAATLAGVLGVIFAPMSQLNGTTLAYAVIPALAAALIGRFNSFLVVVVAGFGLGVVQALIQWLQTLSWFPAVGGVPVPGLADVTIFAVIAILLFTRGDAIPVRGAAIEVKLPPSPVPTRRNVSRATVALILLCIGGLVFLQPDYRQALINTLIGAILCLSFVVITGFVGQVSLLHAGLAGVAALIVTRLGSAGGLPFPIAPILGVLAAIALAVLVALPSLRVRGVQLAIVTMSGAVALSSVVLGNTQFGFNPLSSTTVTPQLFGFNLGPTNSQLTLNGGTPGAVFGLFCLTIVVALMLSVVAIRRSVLGQRMLAVRSNERAAAAAGINARAIKLIAYSISAAIAGVAGVLLSYNFGTSSADNFSITVGLAYIGFAYLGGISTVKGAIIGGLFVTESIVAHFLNQVLGLSPNETLVLAGFLLLVTVVANPGGIALAPSPWRLLRRSVRKRVIPKDSVGSVGGSLS
jgi:branched-chain amino acid transport system permease protein